MYVLCHSSLPRYVYIVTSSEVILINCLDFWRTVTVQWCNSRSQSTEEEMYPNQLDHTWKVGYFQIWEISREPGTQPPLLTVKWVRYCTISELYLDMYCTFTGTALLWVVYLYRYCTSSDTVLLLCTEPLQVLNFYKYCTYADTVLTQILCFYKYFTCTDTVLNR